MDPRSALGQIFNRQLKCDELDKSLESRNRDAGLLGEPGHGEARVAAHDATQRCVDAIAARTLHCETRNSCTERGREVRCWQAAIGCRPERFVRMRSVEQLARERTG